MFFGQKHKMAVFVRIICALAIVLFSFQHRPVFSIVDPAQQSPEAFVYPDGSIASLCLPSGSAPSDNLGFIKSPCEFCRIASATLLPTAPEDFALWRDYAHFEYHSAFFSLTHFINFAAKPPVRAPPELVKI